MEVYTYSEAADALKIKYDRFLYLINTLGFCQNAGESIKTATGRINLITDTGLKTMKDYLEAEQRMLDRRPKTFDQVIAERQKAANAKLTKEVFDALPKQELTLVQNRLANLANEGKANAKNPDFVDLKKREAALLKRLNG